MKYYLGIDGGGTKTKFLLSDENLNILADHTGSSCYYMQCGFDGLTAMIDDGVAHVCQAAGISRDEITYAFGGLAGYDDMKEVNEPIEKAFAAGLNGIPYTIANDSENALAGAHGGEPGINIIAGTGSVAAGRNAAGEVAKCGGGLHVIGTDEGSAYWISIKLLHEFTKQSDGRHPKTLLFDKLCEMFEIEDKQDLINLVVNGWKLERSKIAALSPICAELYDSGEPTAIKVVQYVANEFAEMAIAIYDRLGFEGNVNVTGTGGVFKLGDRLITPLNEKLNAHNMQFAEPKYNPDYGALILAKKMESN